MNLNNIKEEYIQEKNIGDSVKRFWAEILLLPIFVASVWIRYLPVENMDRLQALDPYFIFKQSQMFAYTNHIPFLDFSRYFPYASPQYAEDLGAAIIPATLYKLGPFLVFENYLQYAQFYTPLIGGLSVIAMYFIGKETFNKTTGLTSAFFLGTIAAVMHRSSAGFFEKDPLGGFLGLISIYFFLRGWKKSSWISGILSGTALGLFTWSWGGASFLWLLYALTVAAVLFINVDTEKLIAVFTPTIIIGAVIGFITNPSSLWFTSTDLLPSIGVLAILWLRYLVEKLDLVEENYLDYFVPGVYSLSGIALILSPLYSNFIARKFVGLIELATRDRSGRVVRSTVAESTSMSINQLFTQLGSSASGAINPILGYLSNLIGTWPLAFIGAAAIATSIITMVAVRYNLLSKEITRIKYYQIFSGVFVIWTILFSALFESPGLAVLPSIIMVIGGGILIYMFESEEDSPEMSKIKIDWRYSLVLFWIFSTVIASILESRIIFLAAYPVSLAAGFTASKIIIEAYNIDYSNAFTNAKPQAAKALVITVLITAIIIVNGSAGYVSIQNIGGSPNGLWQENLDYLNEETDPGAVVMSWWDYGYHFQSLGERGTVADGGNKAYYTSGDLLPMELADFFTSENPKNNTGILEKHSVDYIVLDETMIGKYSAVSQIANRDNSDYQFMQQIQTRNRFNQSLTRSGNTTTVEFSGRGFSAFVPIEINNGPRPDIEISGAPTMQTRNGRNEIGCVLTEEGEKEFDVEGSSDFCMSINPYYNFERGFISDNVPTRAVMVPEEIKDHSIVQLYLMDGVNYDFVEKVEGGSNDYVKMWEVNHEELE